MPSLSMVRPREIWLACPSTPDQTDAYWQAVCVWRQAGIELVLSPQDSEHPWPESAMGDLKNWQGLVLWPDDSGQRLCRLARRHGVPVRCWSPRLAEGLQPWSGF